MAVTQRRGRRAMMTPEELDSYLAERRTCRVATVAADGRPHVSPLWFGWHGGSLWLYSLTRSRRWAQLLRDPRVAVVIDDGHDYGELRGVELTGAVEVVGEAPRTGEPCPELDTPERLFAAKYFGLSAMPYDGRHAWLRLTPETISSWDFRKLGLPG
ncbi:pyridoxamine 5'-phosphate oxidase family protein [Streptomyces sparsogenes]|uniref:Putative pyridoxamine 5'-phosphate oxidase-related protein n=1 Tax=Streptomyces sparsogenes DSM 40356 TaxID=1331668 RepID=A0A1R1S8C0_9ACTN|nr:pyridoxamine 5'-phosphate oxidase family protein [Streptomyces sparsogenes]OMI34575.1 putative pyridoxamine 5'-phosphate oxidase-related protein [Streptomyces sparsogenes DSM 40356]